MSTETSQLTTIQSSHLTSPLRNRPIWIPKVNGIAHHPNAGVNPIVDAAAQLFSTLQEIQLELKEVVTQSLATRITKELTDFQLILESCAYSSDVKLASHFSLCATFDDVIANSFLAQEAFWQDCQFASQFHKDANSKRFYLILEHTLQTPREHIELIELMYLTMAFGFKGQYRETSYGMSQLNTQINDAYTAIRHVRGEYTRALAPNTKQPSQLAPPKKTNISWSSYLLTFLTTIIVIAAVTSTLHYIYELVISSLVQ
jgi:type VI secretion system protein ImpK